MLGPSSVVPWLPFGVEGSKTSGAKPIGGGAGPAGCSQNDGNGSTVMEASGSAMVSPELSSGPSGNRCCGPSGWRKVRQALQRLPEVLKIILMLPILLFHSCQFEWRRVRNLPKVVQSLWGALKMTQNMSIVIDQQ